MGEFLANLGEWSALLAGRHGAPGRLLGPHPLGGSNAGKPPSRRVRAFLPEACRAWVVQVTAEGQRVSRPMRRTHRAGIYEAVVQMPHAAASPRYLFRVDDRTQGIREVYDPYAFPTMLTDYDFHLLGEGRHWKSYEKLGGQLHSADGVDGVNFAVWAPNADAVSVVGDFNGWDGRTHQMHKRIPSGIWELFVPGIGVGTLYKFRVHHHGTHSDRSDPYGFAAELPPRTASKVVDLGSYQWQDDAWMSRRAEVNSLAAPQSIYEVHLGSWRRPGDDPHRWLTYADLERELVPYCVEMGFTHVEFLPPTEHPLSASWGYQTIGMFAATSRFGSPQDLMALIDAFHRAGIGVIIDWVPAHFPKDGHGLRQFDGTALYEHEDPRKGEHPDWGTLIYNYGRNEVANFLISSALFWLDRYHIDGLRVDAVASMLYLDYSRKDGEWVPNCFGGRENLEAIEFLKQFNIQVHTHFPGVLTIAEESTSWAGVSRPTYTGGLGFSLKWNMGWMNDTLRYMRHDPIHRKYHHDELTFSLIYAFHENFVLPLSHDEVVHGKGSLLDQMPGDLWQKAANLRLLYAYMWCHPGKKLLFMGGEFGQWQEWNFDESLQWHLCQHESHRGLAKAVADLNQLIRREPALHQLDFDSRGFEWLDCHNWQDSVLTFVRRGSASDDFLVVCCNFTPVPRHGYRLGMPTGGDYDEVFNSDSAFYGGGNVGNLSPLRATAIPHHGRDHSVTLTLPPLAAVVLKPADRR
ncbi:MAG: 1,4-alpha-glucan branching protein GlgB [Planctomycetota bacterium]|jgi:1,4-alpha-glucan branching enzyme|nr:1,4-alpha-glucan branching protein GlgB [Planctomycetota bacterium]